LNKNQTVKVPTSVASVTNDIEYIRQDEMAQDIDLMKKKLKLKINLISYTRDQYKNIYRQEEQLELLS